MVIGIGSGTKPIDFGEDLVPDPVPVLVPACSFVKALEVAILIRLS